MAQDVAIYVETGSKKVFVSATDWPGWSRGAKTEDDAIASLIEYRDRYRDAVASAKVRVPAVAGADDLTITDRVKGDASTDFGMPAVQIPSDDDPFTRADVERPLRVLEACWETFDRVAAAAAGKTLRKGPRGGGREVDQIVDHVLGGEGAYSWKLGSPFKRDESESVDLQMRHVREAIRETVEIILAGDPPPRVPQRGSSLWPLPYFIRRSAWHALDHAWEIEDRVEG